MGIQNLRVLANFKRSALQFWCHCRLGPWPFSTECLPWHGPTQLNQQARYFKLCIWPLTLRVTGIVTAGQAPPSTWLVAAAGRGGRGRGQATRLEACNLKAACSAARPVCCTVTLNNNVSVVPLARAETRTCTIMSPRHHWSASLSLTQAARSASVATWTWITWQMILLCQSKETYG